MKLNGQWECGHERCYDRTVTVPGLVDDPKSSSPGPLWLKRTVRRPAEAQEATLVLKGARFAPEVHVDGVRQSAKQGGMAPTRHYLDLSEAGPEFDLEIALQTLDQLDVSDASHIPRADAFRSNLSSCLWDDVEIFYRGSARIERLYCYTSKDGAVWIHCETGGARGDAEMHFTLQNAQGNEILKHKVQYRAGEKIDVELPNSDRLELWSPDNPVCYLLIAELHSEGECSDTDRVTVARRQFEVRGKRFALNGRVVTLRAGSIVWHRWLRDPEAPELAWNTEWLTENVLLRLKRLGANTLRFHLGMPPDRLLDACDRLGLMVQAEWLFFHGCEASRTSMEKQWDDWFELCFRHPSVCLIHPWNETNPEALEEAWAAIDTVTGRYPSVVLSHRDVEHPHRYWWSLFENVGLYYDSADAFERPIMVDEFGGNYLDGEGVPGGYPKLPESFARFLGHEHTAGERLQLQADASGRMAEYWRRIEAAGFSPFCILGAPEDGNHHYMGALKEGRPKPVWNALRSAYAPVSASLALWDRNFEPEQQVMVDIHLFNDTPRPVEATLSYGIEGKVSRNEKVCLEAGCHRVIQRNVLMPEARGEWNAEAVLDYPERDVEMPPRSCWRVWTLQPSVSSEKLRAAAMEGEPEIASFVGNLGIDDTPPNVFVGGRASYARLLYDVEFKKKIEQNLREGRHVVLLNAGPEEFGINYAGLPFTEQLRVVDETVADHPMPLGLRAVYHRLPEPESVVHPAHGMECLWEGLCKENTAIWAGMKGGIIVPAVDMELTGLSADAFLAKWSARGANPELIRYGPYFAYEKSGYYHFAGTEDDAEANKLNEKIDFLVADAPALENSINRQAPVNKVNLHQQWLNASGGARRIKPLIVCGKSLRRSAAYEVEFHDAPGRLLLTQLLTDGRLATDFCLPDGRRPDPGARQLVLNLLTYLIRD